MITSSIIFQITWKNCQMQFKVLIKDPQSLKNIHLNLPCHINSRKPLNFWPPKADSPLNIINCRSKKSAGRNIVLYFFVVYTFRDLENSGLDCSRNPLTFVRTIWQDRFSYRTIFLFIECAKSAIKAFCSVSGRRIMEFLCESSKTAIG